MRRFLLMSLLLTLCCAGSALADTCGYTGNLVANCGFETGDTSGWTLTQAFNGSDFDIDGTYPTFGTYSASFGAYAQYPDTLSQSISTIVGHTYTLTFYLSEPDFSLFCPTHPDSCSFSADWDGITVYSALPTEFALNFDYNLYSFTGLVATGTSTTISFQGYNTLYFYHLDDVAVVDYSPAAAVPEPSSLLLLGTGLSGLAGVVRRKLL